MASTVVRRDRATVLSAAVVPRFEKCPGVGGRGGLPAHAIGASFWIGELLVANHDKAMVGLVPMFTDVEAFDLVLWRNAKSNGGFDDEPSDG